MELTSKQKVLQHQIKEARDNLLFAKKKVLNLEALCQKNGHAVVSRSSGGAFCLVCGVSLGWYCPKSPTKVCNYDYEKDPLGDCCIYCGLPEERK